MLLRQPLLSQAPAGPSFRIKDPVGRDMAIPYSTEEDSPYFNRDQRDEIQRYYQDNGYVVIRNLVPREQCEAARRWFEREVKPYKGFIYRQATANPERHDFTANGMMLNPILNIQSLDRRRFPHFLDAGLAILTHRETQAAVRAVLGVPGKLVQSMYFDGNPATWAHQDTYYLDAEQIGGMVAGWFAVEDIAPGAGRFFVCPTSHRIDMTKNGGDFDVAFNHARYKELVLDVIRRHGLEFRAPALKQGDVLFWSSKTIHGSLATTQPDRARSSFTAHFIPESSRLLQFQARFRGLHVERINGMPVHKPKDLSRLSPRLVFWIETRFPGPFQTAKKLAIKALTR
jgi:phytanoyl-CoA hydroxylase